MKPMEIVESIRNNTPKVLGQAPDKRAALIIRAAFNVVAAEVAGIKEGTVSVPGLGEFVVKQVKREKDGEKVTVRQVVFRKGKAAVKKAAAKSQA